MAKLLQFVCFFAWALAVVNGRFQILKAGASCNTKTAEPGVCKLLTECGVYLEGLQNETIEYSSILICSFIGQDEVICCPNNDLPTLGHIPTDAPETEIRGGPLPPSQNSSEDNRPEVTVQILKAGASCNTKTGEPGVCKLLSACGVYYHDQTIEYSSINICSFMGQDEVICCPNNDLPTLGHIPTDAPEIGIRGGPLPLSQNSSEVIKPAVAACQKYSAPKLIYTILDGKDVQPGEYPHGKDVQPGEYPHMAALVYDYPALRCGGSLISERYVLTAAHCVINPRPKFVRLGVVEYNPTTEDDTKPVDMEINAIRFHPSYKKSVQHNDIALIELKKDVVFSPFVYPACLHTDRSDIDPDVPLIVIGWGLTNVSAFPSLSNDLLKTNVSTVSIHDCNTTHIAEYPEYDRYHIGLIDGQYCAYDREMKKDVCYGDEGGPLQLVRDNKDLSIVGVVSYGKSCGTAIPSVYSRVAYYLDWIESIVWPAAA